MRIVVDIDDTIIFSRRENGVYHIRQFNDALIYRLNEHYERGDEIICHTGRHWDHMRTTTQQLIASRLKYHALAMGKPPADVYIDDKAVRPDEFLGR
jgi:acid phosphatase class B